MLALYVFAAVVGLSLLALGALGGEAGPDEFELQFDGDLDAGSTDLSWKKWFSMRSAAYFMAGFGGTGLLLTLLDAAPTLTLGLALVMGIASGAFVIALFGWLQTSEGGFAAAADSYIGALGEVRVPIGKTAPGSVAIQHGGRTLTMRARPLGEPDSDPSTWRRVLVVDVEDHRGILLVQPVGEFLTDPMGDDNPPPSPSTPPKGTSNG